MLGEQPDEPVRRVGSLIDVAESVRRLPHRPPGTLRGTIGLRENERDSRAAHARGNRHVLLRRAVGPTHYPVGERIVVVAGDLHPELGSAPLQLGEQPRTRCREPGNRAGERPVSDEQPEHRYFGVGEAVDTEDI